MDKPLSAMKGAEILTYVRDCVTATATHKRTYLEQSAAIGGSPVTREELAEVRALDAAAEIAQFALSAGQDAATKGKAAPEWVMRMIAQVRATLIATKD
jgi:hypothetical protein